MIRPVPDHENKLCSICGERYVEFGHHASPVNNGRCCNRCNALYVIPRKIADELRRRKETDNEHENKSGESS